jgi:tRNA (guanine37-N1)-methyltransferase
MIIDVVTIFPKMFFPIIEESIIKRAQQKGLIKINIHNLRDYSLSHHRKVDAPSYGGGGMVFRVEPVFKAVETILGAPCYSKKERNRQTKIILFTPQGKVLNQNLIKKFLKYERLFLVVPHYEGVDERIRKYLVDEEISIGDYILSGGELPAMVFIDCLVRLLPGVVSDKESIKKESFENHLLDFPHYTRPQVFRGLKVPSILLSGNHQQIEKWRIKKAWERTKKKRPDLLGGDG